MLIFSGAGTVESEFDPTTISGCTLWISGDQDSLVATGDGNPIEEWLDRVTGVRLFGVLGSTARPLYETNEINGLPVARFDATNDIMFLEDGANNPVAASNIWTASAFSIFAVIKPNNAGSTSMTENGKNIVMAGGFVGLCLHLTGGNSKFSFYRFNGGYVGATSTTTYSLGSVYVIQCRYDGTNLKIRVNNDTEVLQAASNPSSLTATPSIGQSNGSDLAEAITYNVHVPDGDSATIVSALADKWGAVLP